MGVTDETDSCRQGQGDAPLRNFVLGQVDCAQCVEFWRRLSLEGGQKQDCCWCGRANGNNAPAASEEAFSPSSIGTIGTSC